MPELYETSGGGGGGLKIIIIIIVILLIVMAAMYFCVLKDNTPDFLESLFKKINTSRDCCKCRGGSTKPNSPSGAPSPKPSGGPKKSK